MVIVIGEEDVPDFPPLNLWRCATCSLTTQQLSRSRSVNAILSVMIRKIAHQLLWLALVISQLLASQEVAVASIAYES